MPAAVLAWLALVNLVTGAMYAKDKTASRRPGARRVRERTLWLLCFAGGVGGAWLVFFAMHHKTRHRSFWLVQIAASVLWIAIILRLILG